MFYKVGKKTIKNDMGDIIYPDIPEGMDFSAIDCGEFMIVKVKEKLKLEELKEIKTLAKQSQPNLKDEEIEKWAIS